jgi:hypothetical protein
MKVSSRGVSMDRSSNASRNLATRARTWVSSIAAGAAALCTVGCISGDLPDSRQDIEKRQVSFIAAPGLYEPEPEVLANEATLSIRWASAEPRPCGRMMSSMIRIHDDDGRQLLETPFDVGRPGRQRLR